VSTAFPLNYRFNSTFRGASPIVSYRLAFRRIRHLVTLLANSFVRAVHFSGVCWKKKSEKLTNCARLWSCLRFTHKQYNNGGSERLQRKLRRWRRGELPNCAYFCITARGKVQTVDADKFAGNAARGFFTGCRIAQVFDLCPNSTGYWHGSSLMAPFFGENIYLIVEENALPAAEKKRERKHIHTYTGELSWRCK